MHIALPKSRGGEKLPPSEQPLGFLAAGCDPALGYVGGFLLTTARGRPLEFHYTTPVKPSGTHRILYGAELEPYVYDTLIGASLLQHCSIEPAFVVTDQPMVLSQRARLSFPIVSVGLGTSSASAGEAAASPELKTHPDFSQDREAVSRWVASVNPGLNLAEPFARIWEAVRDVLRTDPKLAAA